MGIKNLKPASFYIKFLAITIPVVVFGLLLFSAESMAKAVTKPLKFAVCCETPAGFGADFISMHFSTTDGLRLSGWYIPPRNGAVIILFHNYYADRRQTLPVAEMLYKHGYGLLLYDQRASGESEGDSRSLGWLDVQDVRTAVHWLISQQKNTRIGVFGCSIGGAIALAGAVGVPSIRAVAVDAPSPLQWYENLPGFSLQDPLSLPTMAIYYPLVMLQSRSVPPISTLKAVQEVGTKPILFISSGQGDEYKRVSAYFEAAPGPKEHWNIPEANHCGGPTARPEEYQQRLVNFFNSALH